MQPERNLYGSLKNPRHDGGPGAFWQGNGANVLKVMPESAVKFLVYDKAHLWPKRPTFFRNFVKKPLSGTLKRVGLFRLQAGFRALFIGFRVQG